MMTTLSKAALKGKNVEVSFNDGRPDAALSLFWLRDHCQSSQSQHPETKQRLINTFAIPTDIDADRVALEDNGRVLRIDWSLEDHTSRFDADYLADLRAAPDILPRTRQTWDRDGLAAGVPSVSYEGFLQDDSILKDYLEKLESHGLAFVEGSPGTPEATQAVARRITYIRETIFGGYWDFTANMEHKDTAYTSMAIGPHTDHTYAFDAPGYQMFHCLAAECTGGENVLIDGFKIAELMRRDHPAEFKTLTEVAIPGEYLDHDRGIHLMARRPLFRLNDLGELVQVSYNNHDRASFTLTPARQEAFYQALATFAGYCTDERLQYRRRLLPGSILLFDNWRVLHARDAYTGYRRLTGAYLNKDEVESRLRVLRIKANEAV